MERWQQPIDRGARQLERSRVGCLPTAASRRRRADAAGNAVFHGVPQHDTLARHRAGGAACKAKWGVNMPEHGQSITFAEYDAIPETTRFTELIGGVLILSPSVTDDHQRTVGNILYLLHEKAPDGEVYPTLTGVYLDDENVVEPDVIWLAKDGHCKVE